MNRATYEINNLNEIQNYLEGIKVIIFDLDDTLYDEKDYVKSGFRVISKILINIDNVEEKLWNYFIENKKAIDELFISEKIDDIELKKECINAYRFQNPDISLSDKNINLIKTLKNKGFKLGIITDGRVEGQRAKIEALNLDNYFDYIIITDELGGIEYRKPNSKAFELMHNYFNIDYNQMCYVGDNIHKDFIAPNTLGMKSFYFKNKLGLYSKERGSLK